MKQRHFLPLLLLILETWFVQPEAKAQHQISGTIHNYTDQMIRLNMLKGDKKYPVDSVKTNSDGYFLFRTADWYRVGMYELVTKSGNHFRILYNKADVRFISNSDNENAIVEFIRSDENKLWYDYVILKDKVLARQELIKPVLQQYPRNELFYKQALETYNELQKSLKQKTDSIYFNRSETLAARLMRADMPPMIDLSLDFDAQRQQLKDHFFDQTDFADTLLLYSDVLTSKMIDYLSLYQRPSMGMAEVQLVFMQALDVIFEKASVEKTTYLFTLEYFIEGFAKMGFTAVTDFLSNLPHLNADCMDLETSLEIERIAGPHRKVVLGSAAPEISMTDINGNAFHLKDTQGKVKILLFWSVNCPHCISILPELEQLASHYPQVQVISFVLSNDIEKLKSIIAQEKLNWTHLSDGLGWASPVSEAYMVYGTPTFFVLNTDNTILSKPSGIAEMEVVLKNYFTQDK
ncbi:MAG: redoxin domain-containing protein [Bacteroidales bacterium]|nr:redoxin domain-containing protein [Bacteroidales bacterium]